MRKNNKKAKKRILILLIALVLVAAAGSFAYGKARDYAAEQLVSGLASEMAGESVTSQDTSATLAAEALYDSLSPQDKDTVNEIISNHVSLENVNAVRELMAENDTQGLKEFAAKTLTSEELSTIADLYDEYRDGE